MKLIPICKLFITVLCSVYADNNMILGDIILSSSSPIDNKLSQKWNTTFNNFATIGSGIIDGWVISIPRQYELHKDTQPNNIIMNGGGKDILTMKWDCLLFNEKCKNTIDYMGELLQKLFNDMKNNSVENIIYIGQYYNNGLFTAIDYYTNIVQNICHEKNNCYYIDLHNIYIPTNWDGVRPIDEGYDFITNEISQVITKYNISLH